MRCTCTPAIYMYTSATVVGGRNEVNSKMSRNEMGIPPYRPERDDELAQEALRDDMLQTSDEPIQQDDENETTEAWAFSPEAIYDDC